MRTYAAKKTEKQLFSSTTDQIPDSFLHSIYVLQEQISIIIHIMNSLHIMPDIKLQPTLMRPNDGIQNHLSKDLDANENTRSMQERKTEAPSFFSAEKGISIHDYSFAIDMHQQLSSVKLVSSIPPYIHDVDDSSISSLESLNDAADRRTVENSRSIFHEFWQEGKKESEPKKRSCSIVTLDTASSTFSKGNSRITQGSQEWSHPDFTGELIKPNRRNITNAYEEVLMINESGRTVIPSSGILKKSAGDSIRPRSQSMGCAPQPPRRTIFTEKYSSVQSPVSSYGYQLPTDKDGITLRQSDSLASLLQNKRYLKPSLRDRSISYDSSTMVESSVQSSQSKLTVSFDPNVSIHEFNKPYENYIAPGWSKLFA